MKKIILKVFCFLLPIILAGVCMEILLRNIPNDYLYKKEHLDKHSNEIETLILGSSHAFYGFDPIYFSSKTFNASHVSQTLDYDFEIFKKYQDNFNSLKTLIVPISYASLWEKLENTTESWRVKNYSLYYKINISKSIVNNTELFSNNLKTNIRRVYHFYVKNEKNISCSSLGWGTDYKSINSADLIETGKTAAERHTEENINAKESSKVFNDNIAILNSLVESCKKQNIRIIFITPPAYKTYIENLNKEQKTKTIETMTNFANRNNCEYLNLLEDSSFVSDDFFDADHLNEIGAKKLSMLLMEKID